MRFFVNLPQATAISVNNTMVPQDTLAGNNGTNNSLLRQWHNQAPSPNQVVLKFNPIIET